MLSIMIGPHEVCADQELIIVRYHGVVTLDHVMALFVIMEKVKHQYGAMLLLADLSAAGVMEPPARRYISENVKEEAHPVFMFGIAAIPRMLISLMLRAITLLGRRPPKLRFLATEREAREEMEAVRTVLRAERAVPGLGPNGVS
jgi:hypothetical protein